LRYQDGPSIIDRVITFSARLFHVDNTSLAGASNNTLQEKIMTDYLEPYFAPLGQEVRENVASFQKTWVDLSLGDGPPEKVFAVLLGYAVMAIFLTLYLNILTVGNVQNAGRAVRNAVRQQLLVVKVSQYYFGV
jgi:E3 ubiquitin-protein ligase MARCH6